VVVILFERGKGRWFWREAGATGAIGRGAWLQVLSTAAEIVVGIDLGRIMKRILSMRELSRDDLGEWLLYYLKGGKVGGFGGKRAIQARAHGCRI
jgi:hypothetical protein